MEFFIFYKQQCPNTKVSELLNNDIDENIKWIIWYLSHVNIVLVAHRQYRIYHWISLNWLWWICIKKFHNFTYPSVIKHTQDAWLETVMGQRKTDWNSWNLTSLTLISVVKQLTGDQIEKWKKRKRKQVLMANIPNVEI